MMINHQGETNKPDTNKPTDNNTKPGNQNKPSQGNSPQTSDTSMVGYMGTGIAAIAGIFLNRRRKK